jgi:hypothetical protein
MLRLAAGGLRLRSARFAAQARPASTLVVAEHNHKVLNPGTLSAVTAASQIGGEVRFYLCASHSCIAKCKSASQLQPCFNEMVVDDYRASLALHKSYF